MKISAIKEGILFTCHYCQVGAIIRQQESKRAFMRHLNKFDREHHNCELKIKRQENIEKSKKSADEILAKLMKAW
jgi:hypothetical protein